MDRQATLIFHLFFSSFVDGERLSRVLRGPGGPGEFGW